MPHHFVIETEREVDTVDLLELIIDAYHDRRYKGWPTIGGHVDHDAAAAERAIAQRDRAIRLLVEEVGEQYGLTVRDVIADFAAPMAGFPAEVVDTIRHVCGIDDEATVTL